ncbi:MAG: dihydroneopterin aldolase [Pseudomonadota bacterium]
MTTTDSDIVSIEGLNVDTVIGVYDWEQQQSQRLVIDMQMACDIQAAANSDNIAEALDYATVSEAVTNWVQQQPRQLIETVAEGIAALILKDFAVAQVEVKVSKPGAVVNAGNVAVTIKRTRFDSPFG